MTNKSGLFLVSLLLTVLLWMSSAYAETMVTLNIENMTCSMCAITIKKALQKVEGVQNVSVDYDAKTAVVTFDSDKTNSSALIKATTNAGYPGSLATPITQ